MKKYTAKKISDKWGNKLHYSQEEGGFIGHTQEGFLRVVFLGPDEDGSYERVRPSVKGLTSRAD